MDENLRRHPQFQNFVSVSRGFAYVGKTLEPYTRAGLQTVHQDGYKRFAGLPPCTQRCSDHHGRDTSQWCPTCTTWRNYLLQKHRSRRVRWECTESWRWCRDYESIADTFLPPTWSNTETQLEDFTTACYIWSNCREFNLEKSLIQKLRQLRNTHVGHNARMKVTESNKVTVFNELKKILSCNAVQAYVNITECKQALNNIAKADEMTSVMNYLFRELNAIGSAQTNFAESLNDIVTILNLQNKHTLKPRDDKQNNPKRRFKKPSTVTVVIGLAVLLLSIISNVKYSQNEDCLSEMYSYPFPQDMPLMPYVKEHDSLVGREWLFEEIKTLILHKNSRMKGVLLTADIGYGKSAIVKHLLCSKEHEKGHAIKERTVAFHICKFDVPSTSDAQKFVHRIIAFLATKFPEFGGIISLLPDSSLVFDRDKCRKEIVACFDQGILHPLNEFKSKPVFPLFIIIDALDECLNDKTRDNDLFQLILSRYRKMPKWMQFIITSRNVSIVNRLHSLKIVHLEALDERNIVDIKSFVKNKASLHPNIFHNNERFDTLLDKSEGNFLFVVHLIDYLLENYDAKNNGFPNTLFEVYEINFERHFSQDKTFKTAKSILEIVVASLQPLDRNEVKAILKDTNPIAFSSFSDIFEKLRFCFRSTEKLTIVHQALHSWLISEENTQFHISIENGHAMLSKYLLGKIGSNRMLDIAEIIIHVANSKSSDLVKAFEAASASFNITQSSIHRLIWKSDSEHALKLLFKLNVDVDTLNEGNVTPAFVAAARGNLNQLKYLKSRGADLNFIVNYTYLITSPKQIDIIKHDYYFGYGLIHIATQFGHVDIVEYLLQQNKSTAHTRNGLRLTVIEVACENGHLAILKLVGKYVSNFGNCVYYAAKNGHTDIIRHAIKLGVNTSCISMEEATEAFNTIFKFNDSKPVLKFRSGDIVLIKYEIYDLWWVVHQESALHAAISAHNSEIVKQLVYNYPHLVECKDTNGMVPFLLSVALNETKSFHILIERVTRDKCSHPSNFAQTQDDEKRKSCPLGASYSHIDAIYRRFDLTKVLFAQGITIDWLLPDAMSITAVHYAACSDNSHFLHIVGKTLKFSYNNIRTNNGSSPFHSAAICGSLGSIHVMTSSLTYNIPNLKDSENKTILHYLALREFSGNPAKGDIITQSIYVHILMAIINNSAIILNETDCYKRNVIHYALKNGHFMIVDHFYQFHSDLLGTMLNQEDINGATPVQFAVRNGSFHPENIVLPNNCSFYDLFLTYCGSGEQFVNHLSSIEYGLLRVVTFLKSEMFSYFTPIFQDLLKKSPYLTTAMLVHLKRPALGIIKTKFIESIRESLPLFSVYSLARHRPKLFSACGMPFQESPLHLMAYRLKINPVLHYFNFRLYAFGRQIDMKSLSCADRDGYNSFHYSLLAGNIKMARMLLDTGVNITNTKVVHADIPWMVLLGKKNEFYSFDLMCSDQLFCMDDLLYKIFEKFGNKFSFSDICNENIVRLSLVHIIGASGFVRTLKVLEKLFGARVIKCKTRHGISPLYLGDLWNERNWRDTLESSDASVPHGITEPILFMLLVNTDLLHHACMVSASRYDKYSAQKFTVCVNRYRIYFTNTYSVSSILKRAFVELQLFDTAVGIALKFQNAILTKNISELGLYLKYITDLAKDFEDMLGEIGMTHNYRGLKQLISLQTERRHCSLHEREYHKLIPCFKVFIEFNHMVRKTITSVKSQLLRNCYKQISTTRIKDSFFMKTKLKQVMLRSAFELSRLNPYLAEFLSEHSYLHILQKTVKYQYVSRHFSKGILVPINSFDTKFASDITKPFDDLKQHNP